ncbi:YrbL family protein [Gymnodinialimonas ulvae]|uniref:YrbL family protein n=1 Tax=Gymnodinialimonas ulvae TaxID=3126504 RepID=UPI0030AE860D
MNGSNQRLVLSGQTPVGKGSVRDVYAHPDRPGYLIKVFNDRKLVDASQGVRGAARFVRPHYPYDDFVREQNEYTRCILLGHKLGCRVPIAEIATVTLTDLGPGQVVRRISDGAGAIGKTVSMLLREDAFGDEEFMRLNGFMRDLWTLEINAPDLSCDNVAFDGEAGQFVLVDGIGEKTLLPVRAWIGALNRKKLHQMAHRMGRYINADWNEDSRQFTAL